MLHDLMHAYAGALPVLLICPIPMTYLAVCWKFTLPLIVDQQMDFWPAMKTSFKMVNKHWWQVFGLTIHCRCSTSSALLACCVGVLFTFPIGIAALMFAYETIFSAPRGKAVSRAKARNAALLNLLATPGLGSLLAGRWIAGTGQLALALAGFTLFLVWFVKIMIQYYGQMCGDAHPRGRSIGRRAVGPGFVRRGVALVAGDQLQPDARGGEGQSAIARNFCRARQ